MKKTWSYHPVLFALYPVLFLYSQNVYSYPPQVIIVPSVIFVLFSLTAWALLARLFKSPECAALLVSFFLFWFGSYGHVYGAVWHFFSIHPFTVGAGRVLLPLFGLIFIIGVWLIVKIRHSPGRWTRVANFTSIVLLIVPIFHIGTHIITSSGTLTNGSAALPARGTPIDTAAAASYPDIYYLVIDGYARADVLQELYNTDNREFMTFLAEKGFYIAADARANYCQTALSLSSSLNMRYLDPAADRLDPESENRVILERLIKHGTVLEFLRARGYTIAAFSTGCYITELKDADVFFQAGTDLWFFDEFQNGLANTTLLRVFLYRLHYLPFSSRGIGDANADVHRQNVLAIFSRLRAMRWPSGPRFVFAHIFTPHPPFLFGRDGEHIYPKGVYTTSDGSRLFNHGTVTREEYRRKYADQLTYTSRLLMAALDSILAKSPRPPVIILQADHGPGLRLDWYDMGKTNLKERLSILSAYYLPDGADTMLYQSITPVNTFRVIFNHYHGAQFELLDDRSYFSSYYRPYQLTDVTAELVGRTESGIDSEQQTIR